MDPVQKLAQILAERDSATERQRGTPGLLGAKASVEQLWKTPWLELLLPGGERKACSEYDSDIVTNVWKPAMVNRGALLIRPAEPYHAWAKSVFGEGIAPSLDGERTVYLVPDDEADRGVEWILRQVWAEVFERELEGWCTDESTWPHKRTLPMFKKWFGIEYHTVVEDLCGWPLEDDEFDPP